MNEPTRDCIYRRGDDLPILGAIPVQRDMRDSVSHVGSTEGGAFHARKEPGDWTKTKR